MPMTDEQLRCLTEEERRCWDARKRHVCREFIELFVPTIADFRTLAAARDAGESAALRRQPENTNPYPEGSSVYCAWQNAYWGARSHLERVNIISQLAGNDFDEDADYDPPAMIAALRQRVEELREQITNGRSAHNDDRVRADTLWRDRDTLRQRVAGLEKVMRSVRTSMIELGPMNAADISNDVIGEIDAALAARPTGGEG